MIRSWIKRNLRLLSRLFAVAAILSLLIGIGLARRQHQNNQTAQPLPMATENRSEPAPSTDKPPEDAFKNHQVAPDAPRYLFIPRISVRAMVKSVGLTVANQIESPRNVFDVGWFKGSAKPGQPGAMVVDGHVSSWGTPGVFQKLKDLRAGDTISIERGDSAVFTFKVVKSLTFDADKVDMAAATTPITGDKPGLNLISCTGKVIKGTNEFEKRIIVFAEQQ